MSKLLVSSLITLAVVVSGCGGTTVTETTGVLPDSRLFVADELEISYPRSWRVLTKKDFTSNTPAETKIVFQRNVQGNVIVNVSVGRVKLGQPISSLDFAKNQIHQARNGLLNFEEVAREDIFINVGADTSEDTVLITYKAKGDAEKPVLQFVQAFVVKGDFAYTLTGTMSETEAEEVVNIVKNMIKSFRLK